MTIESKIQQDSSQHIILVTFSRSEFDGEFGGEDHVADPEGWGGIPECPDLNMPLLVIGTHDDTDDYHIDDDDTRENCAIEDHAVVNFFFQKNTEIARWSTGCYIDGEPEMS